MLLFLPQPAEGEAEGEEQDAQEEEDDDDEPVIVLGSDEVRLIQAKYSEPRREINCLLHMRKQRRR